MIVAFLLAISCSTALLPGPRPQEAEGLPRVLGACREARGSWEAEAIIFEGEGEFRETDVEVRLEVQSNGRFRLGWTGPMAHTVTFDGDRAWKVDARAGVPYPLDLVVGDTERCWAGVWTGAWLEEGFGFELSLAQGSASESLAVQIRSPRSSFAATLTLNPETFLPAGLTAVGFGGEERWYYADFLDVEGIRIAGEVSAEDVGGSSYRVFLDDGFAMEELPDLGRPGVQPTQVNFDPGAPASVPVELDASGHLMIKPLINGEDIGWFAFDTGAPVSVIETWAAEKMGLPAFGSGVQAGAGANVRRTQRREVSSLELGPISLEDPVFVEMKIGMRHRGELVAGIIGWDVLIQSVVEIDMQAPSMQIHPPAGYELGAGEWQDMVLHSLHPHVTGRFEGDREGLFRLDTGAGSSTVTFHTPAVDRFELLKDRKTSPASGRGAGGPISLRVGSIEWFEIAGHRTENPRVKFCRDEKGALADPNTLGNMGGGLLRPFVLVFDYQQQRVAFVRRAETRLP